MIHNVMTQKPVFLLMTCNNILFHYEVTADFTIHLYN